MHDQRPCLVCGRIEDDPLHQPGDRGGLSTERVPRLEQHPYDPGERRKGKRRVKDQTEKAWDEAAERHASDEWNREHQK